MNNKNSQTATVINLEDLIWDLLAQWKSILVVAVLVSLLITGLKYYKDINYYKESEKRESETTEVTWQSKEEYVDSIMNAVPEDERALVTYMLRQKEWLKQEEDYINNSILLNENPTSQRTLMMDYYISSENSDKSVMATLAYSYSAYARNEKIIDGLRQIIDPTMEDKYIAELISYNSFNTSFDDGDVVIEIGVVIPEGINIDSVEQIFTSSFEEYSKELNKTVGSHTIKRVRSDAAKLYNTSAVNNKNSILNSVYNIYFTFNKNMEAFLTDSQRAAISAITNYNNAQNDIEHATDVNSSTEKHNKPKPSKKYALFGFILGVMMYTLLYILLIIIKGRISSAKQLSYYSYSRLIGEVYFSHEYKGFEKLLHSRFIEKTRFGNKLDENVQIRKIVSSIKALSEYHNDSVVSVFMLCKEENDILGIRDKLIGQIKDKGLDITIKNITDETDDRDIQDTEKAICIIEKGIKIVKLTNFIRLMEDFDIRQIGNVFVGEV